MKLGVLSVFVDSTTVTNSFHYGVWVVVIQTQNVSTWVVESDPLRLPPLLGHVSVTCRKSVVGGREDGQETDDVCPTGSSPTTGTGTGVSVV